jgi:hypothetical protein
MRRISSRMTFWYKRVLPAKWVGFLLLFVMCPFLRVRDPAQLLPTMSLVIMPALFGVFFYFVLKRRFSLLVDTVFDDGDALVIRNRNMEERIALSDIVNVSSTQFFNPPRITLMLRNRSLFGERVSFCLPARYNPFSPSPIVYELIKRIDAERSKP